MYVPTYVWWMPVCVETGILLLLLVLRGFSDSLVLHMPDKPARGCDNNASCEAMSSDLGFLAAGLERSLRTTLQQEAQDSDRRARAAEQEKVAWEHQRSLRSVPAHLSNGFRNKEEQADNAVHSLHAKEEEIQRRKLQVREKVEAQLSRVEQEARRLDELRRELEGLEDPTKKEVADIRKKIETVDRDLRPLKQLCEKKEKELKDAVEAYNEKSKIKTELVCRLMEIVTLSERLRMQKLDELNVYLEAMNRQQSG